MAAAGRIFETGLSPLDERPMTFAEFVLQEFPESDFTEQTGAPVSLVELGKG